MPLYPVKAETKSYLRPLKYLSTMALANFFLVSQSLPSTT